MGLFKKTPEEKAAKAEAKAVSQDKQVEVSAHLGKVEKLDVAVQMLMMSISEKLTAEEHVLGAMSGQLDGAKGLLVATDSRLLIEWKKGMSEFGDTEMRYKDVDEIQTGRNFGGSFVKLVHGSRVTKLEKSLAGDKALDALKQIVRDQQAASGPAPQAATVVQAADPMEQLKKAAELHAAGILSDEEFAAVKAKALA